MTAPRSAPSRARSLLRVLALCLPLAGCLAAPPSHLTRVWVQGETGEPVYGLSTEDGVLVRPSPGWNIGDRFELHHPAGNSLVRDWGRLDRRNDDLAVIRPLTSRFREGRLATTLPASSETIYLALRDRYDEQEMRPVELWRDGRLGDFIVPPDGMTPDELATTWSGVGLYVKRDCRLRADWAFIFPYWIERACRWEIVGLLTDVVATRPGDPDDPGGVGFVAVNELARVLPDQVDYFEHPILPPRPDFEYGVPLQPGDIVLPEEEAADGETPAGTTPSGRP